MKKELEISTTSENLQNQYLQKLQAIFPQFVKEGAINFDALQNFFEKEGFVAGTEKYGLNWAGRTNAFQAIRMPSTGTLIPQKDESVHWDKTENIFIEGDNLEVLKLLQKHYREKVKMIYIDPPYNTGKDFIYKDNFTQSVADYYEESGQTEGGIKMTTNAKSNGRYHSDWLTMMYPRLFLAKNLLRDDGVIFISIDDNEVANLRLVMDEIFGEENFVGQITWHRKRGKDNSAKFLSRVHEFVLVYSRMIEVLNFGKIDLSEQTLSQYTNPDNDPRGNYRKLALWRRGGQGGSREYSFKTKSGSLISPRAWLVNEDTMNRLDEEDRLVVIGDNLYRKLFLDEHEGSIPETIWNDVSNTANATDMIKSLFDVSVFDTPKPIELIQRMLKLSTSGKDEFVLDFFAGSGTTAHAVMDLNAEDGGNRKWISVQLPEVIEEGSEAYKAGYKTIAEISRERIRRAGKKILEGKADKIAEREQNLDTGFKAYSLQPSNYRIWKKITDENTVEDLLEQSKLFVESPLLDGYTEENVVYEILLKEGFDLKSKITRGDDELKTYIAQRDNKKLFITFAKTVTLEQVESLGLNEHDIFACFDKSLDDTNKNNINRNFNLRVI